MDIIRKIKAMGSGAGTRWMNVATAAMAGNDSARAACAEILGRPVENMADLYAIQSAAYDAMTSGEQRESDGKAMQDLNALHDASVDAAPYLSNKLGMLRKKAGMTQKELAEKAGMPIVTLQKLENGTNSILRARTETSLALSRALGITVEELTAID